MKASGFLKQNLGLVGMILFLALFYSLLALAIYRTPKEMIAQKSEKLEKVTALDLKDREAVFRENLQKNPRLLGQAVFAVLGLLLGGFFLSVYLWARSAQGQAFLTPVQMRTHPPWGLREVVQVFVFLFFAEALIFCMEAALSWIWSFEKIQNDLLLMINSLFRDILAAIFVVVLVRKKFKRPLADIGLVGRKLFQSIFQGLLAYWAVVPYLVLLLFLLSALAQAVSYEPPPQVVVQMYLKRSTEPYLFFFTAFVALLGPALEEIFFRGFAYGAFRARWGVWGAASASAFLFALMHMNVLAFLPIFALGVFLCTLYEKTGSLVPSMAAHMTHNLIMVGLTLGFRALSA